MKLIEGLKTPEQRMRNMNDIIQDKKLSIDQYRTAVMTLEEDMKKIPGAMIGDCCPLAHSFADGCCIREIFLPAGMILVTKIHKKNHPYFIMKGDVSVMTEDGFVRLRGPYHGITKAGTKRIIYVNEDTIWITVHVTNEKDIKKIEDEVIAKTFEELERKENVKEIIDQDL